MLLPDDQTALLALRAIRGHVAHDGLALIPLFIPTASGWPPGSTREVVTADGATLRVTSLSEQRSDELRTQTTILRYEKHADGASEVADRSWVLHWHTRSGFEALVAQAGLAVREVRHAVGAEVASSGKCADDATEFTFVVAIGR